MARIRFNPKNNIPEVYANDLIYFIYFLLLK